MTGRELLDILSLREKGMSIRKIAKSIGKPKSTIGDFLKKRSHKDFWRVYDSGLTAEESVEASQPKVLVIDIETSPMLGWVWSMFKQFLSPNQVEHDQQILCFSAKWLGDDNIISEDARGDYPIQLFVDNCKEAQIEMLETLWHLLNNADMVIGHNAKAFDVKRINSKFVEFGFPPPSHFKVIDTLHIVKNSFAAPTNKLAYWSALLGKEGKMTNDGMPLWIGCMRGEQHHWENMVEYCERDVTELEEVYMAIRAWSNKHPSMAPYYNDGKEHCVVCGGTHFTKIKSEVTTNQSSFEQFSCDGCGAINRRKRNTRSKESMKNTMMTVPRM